MRRMSCVSGMLVLLVLVGVSQPSPAAWDLTQVQGMKAYDGPEAGKAMLAENGFVVVQRFYRRIFSPYLPDEAHLPHFITADSVHRTFHVIFEEELRKVEGTFLGETRRLLDQIAAGLDLLEAKEEPCAAALLGDADALGLAKDFIEVGRALVARREGEEVLAGIREEVGRCVAAGEVCPSSVFGYPMDYTQFEPRGFYTKSEELKAYFRTMSWFGNGAFRLKSVRETKAALLLAKALEACPGALAQWKRLDGIYTHLLGGCDDLTPLEYLVAMEKVADGADSTDWVAAFQRKADELRDPTMNSMVLTPGQMANWVEESKGMRFMGKRYVPDGEVMMLVTDPSVPGRGFPSGLDVMAANGSTRARALLEGAGVTPQHEEALGKARKVLDEMKAAPAMTHYARFLKVAEALTQSAVEQAAPFAKTEAYADKNLMTALAGWASMRHAWILHAKQTAVYLGGPEGTPSAGYVEPNRAFFGAMTDLNRQTVEILQGVPTLDVARFEAFGDFLDMLTRMVDKELAGTPFTSEEEDLLTSYAYVIARLQGHSTNNLQDEAMPWMGLVADVHSEMLSEECLEVATGGALPIYVIVEHDGAPWLLIGAVYSYYEFRQPVGERLTDEAWDRMWDQCEVPDLPRWTASFVAPFDGAESAIEAVLRGEQPSQAVFLRDGAFDDFLYEAVQPDGPLVGKENYSWALSLAARHLGDRIKPLLLDMIQSTPPPVEESTDARSRGRQRVPLSQPSPQVALRALGPVFSADDAAPLLDTLMSATEDVANDIVMSLTIAEDKALEDFWLKALSDAPFERTRRRAGVCLAMQGSVDVTPQLLDMWPRASTAGKGSIINVLAGVWKEETDASRKFPLPRIEAAADRADIAEWQKKVAPLALKTFAEESKTKPNDKAREDVIMHERVLKDCASLAGALRIRKAVPYLLENCAEADKRENYGEPDPFIEALAKIGSDAAVKGLVALSKSDPADREVIVALGRTDSPVAMGHLRELLGCKEDSRWGYLRVCDLAAAALAEMYPEGPGSPLPTGPWCTPPEEAPYPESDAKIAEWVEYLESL